MKQSQRRTKQQQEQHLIITDHLNTKVQDFVLIIKSQLFLRAFWEREWVENPWKFYSRFLAASLPHTLQNQFNIALAFLPPNILK